MLVRCSLGHWRQRRRDGSASETRRTQTTDAPRIEQVVIRPPNA